MTRRMAPRSVVRPHVVHEREHIVHVPGHGGEMIGTGIVICRGAGLARLVFVVDTSTSFHRDDWRRTVRLQGLDAKRVWESSVRTDAGFPTLSAFDVSGTPAALEAAKLQRCTREWHFV